jgi:hypothetical protein
MEEEILKVNMVLGMNSVASLITNKLQMIPNLVMNKLHVSVLGHFVFEEKVHWALRRI